MSFFKKLTDEFKELIKDDKDKDKSHDHSSHGGHQDYQHSAPPPGPPPPQGQPQLPPGWIAQWDGNSQRWYYLEQATGRTQWDFPGGYQSGHGSTMPAEYGYMGHDQHTSGYGHGYSSGHGYSGHDQHGMGHGSEHDKKHGMGGMVAAGAGGVAVGALAAHALSDSDDESHGAAHGTAPIGYGAPPPAQQPLEYNQELSSSQRSSLHSAREDLAEAEAEVANESDPSSSDVEELEEAREEYHSEVESAHEELEE